MECVGSSIPDREIFSPLDEKNSKVVTRLVCSKKRDKESKQFMCWLGNVDKPNLDPME